MFNIHTYICKCIHTYICHRNGKPMACIMSEKGFDRKMFILFKPYTQYWLLCLIIVWFCKRKFSLNRLKQLNFHQILKIVIGIDRLVVAKDNFILNVARGLVLNRQFVGYNFVLFSTTRLYTRNIKEVWCWRPTHRTVSTDNQGIKFNF